MLSRPRRAQTTIVLPSPQVSSSVTIKAASIADVAGLQAALNEKASTAALAAKADAAVLSLKVDRAEMTQAISQIVPSGNIGGDTATLEPGPGLECVGGEIRLDIDALPLAPEN